MTPFWYLKRHFSKFWPISAYFWPASLFAYIERTRAPVYSKWRARAPPSEYNLKSVIYWFLKCFRAKNDIFRHLGTSLEILRENGPKSKSQKFLSYRRNFFFPISRIKIQKYYSFIILSHMTRIMEIFYGGPPPNVTHIIGSPFVLTWYVPYGHRPKFIFSLREHQGNEVYNTWKYFWYREYMVIGQ